MDAFVNARALVNDQARALQEAIVRQDTQRLRHIRPAIVYADNDTLAAAQRRMHLAAVQLALQLDVNCSLVLGRAISFAMASPSDEDSGQM